MKRMILNRILSGRSSDTGTVFDGSGDRSGRYPIGLRK
jgi:hypothetical protein